jgi:hypothetical protein
MKAYNKVASAFLEIRFNPSDQCHPCAIIKVSS